MRKHAPASFRPVRLSRIAHRHIRDAIEAPNRENLTALAAYIEGLEKLARYHGAQGINGTILVRY